MPGQGRRGGMMEGLLMPTKIRKRGCSSSSSSSSRIHNKKAILRGKNRAGLGIALGRSRSSTPVPTWRTTPFRSAVESPKYSQSGRSTLPVSARRLAATLWEMNEMPSPKMSESNFELLKMKQLQKKNGKKLNLRNEQMQPGWGLQSGLGPGSGYLPPHLSDPSYSPTVSQKMDRSGTSSRRRTPSRRVTTADEHVVGAVDSISHASFMEIETRSRPQTSSGSVSGCRGRLKDVSNALTTSKELLKIITRIWGNSDRAPSSSSSSAPLITALHAELERARLQVNQLIQEQRVDKNEISYIMKCFAEEKASWKSKEEKVVEAAVASVAGELEVERKLRHRFESLNKKLGKELSEMKSSLMKAVKELESEKRAREITEQVCDELASNLNGDMEKFKRESVEVYEEVGQEREMLELADKLHEERAAQMKKLSEANHQFEESNSAAIGKLRKQLEVFLRTKGENDEEGGLCFSQSSSGCFENGRDGEKAEEAMDGKEGSEESDLLELNMDNKVQKWAYASSAVSDRDSRKLPVATNEIKPRNSMLELLSLRSGSLLRSVSDGVDVFGRDGPYELEKEAPRRSHHEGTQRNKSVRVGLKDHRLSTSRLSVSQKNEQAWASRDPFEERSSAIQTSSSKARTTADVVRESHSTRRSKW